jgi:hypothetical protein
MAAPRRSDRFSHHVESPTLFLIGFFRVRPAFDALPCNG